MKNRQNWLYAVLALTGGMIGGTLAAELAPTVAMAARQMHTVRAQEFELVDKEGNQRGVMQVNSRGTADLELMDGSGRDRAEFRVSKDGNAAVAFFDQDGNRRVLVGAAGTGRNGVGIYGANGRQLASLAAAEDTNESNLTLYDPTTGRARVGLGVTNSGAPALVLFDDKGRDRLELHIGDKGNPGIALANESGKSIAGLPEQEAPQQQQQQQ
jgi:hypothetical protein